MSKIIAALSLTDSTGLVRKATIFTTEEELGDSLKAVGELLMEAGSEEEAISLLQGKNFGAASDRGDNSIEQQLKDLNKRFAHLRKPVEGMFKDPEVTTGKVSASEKHPLEGLLKSLKQGDALGMPNVHILRRRESAPEAEKSVDLKSGIDSLLGLSVLGMMLSAIQSGELGVPKSSFADHMKAKGHDCDNCPESGNCSIQDMMGMMPDNTRH